MGNSSEARKYLLERMFRADHCEVIMKIVPFETPTTRVEILEEGFEILTLVGNFEQFILFSRLHVVLAVHFRNRIVQIFGGLCLNRPVLRRSRYSETKAHWSQAHQQ